MKVLLSVVFWFICTVSFSQAVMDFPCRSHDFGMIEEGNGVVGYDFECVNTGNLPLLIKNIGSSCGCTVPLWSKQPVLPGGRGVVKVAFDPNGRPGFFDKTITICSNVGPAVIELKNKGRVKGKARMVLDDYPYELASGLRLSMEHIALMRVEKGDVKSAEIGVYNNAGKPVTVSFMDVPAYLRINIEPQYIADNGRAILRAAYSSALHGEYGLNKDRITLVVDGKEYLLPVSVFIEEKRMPTDPSTAPRIEADKRYYHFGETTPDRSVSFTYRLKNTGKTPLTIYRIYTDDERVTTGIVCKELQPGDTTILTVQTVPGAETGKVTCQISVITDAPATPELILRFYGNIEYTIN